MAFTVFPFLGGSSAAHDNGCVGSAECLRVNQDLRRHDHVFEAGRPVKRICAERFAGMRDHINPSVFQKSR
jgi:hypothetical protein